MLPALQSQTDFSCAGKKDIYILSFFDEYWLKAVPDEIISKNMKRDYVFISRQAIMPTETFFVAKIKTGEQD